MTSVNNMDKRQVEALFDLLPNAQYNPVFVVGEADEVIELLPTRGSNCLILCVADIDTVSTRDCECYIIREFEDIDYEPGIQEKVADFIGNCILQKQQIIIISKIGINTMKLEGRLRSRVCSGVIIE